MKILGLFFALLLTIYSTTIGFAQSADVNVIPKPTRLTRKAGEFEITSNTRIVVEDAGDRSLAQYLSETINNQFGIRLKVESGSTKHPKIYISRPDDYLIVNQGYSISTDKNLLTIKAATAAGRFYGIQTLLQLARKDGKKLVVPNVGITDWARFPYRGMHLDVSRHFMPVQFVKKYIDLMAQYKFNYFHWHLTDDQGWRIEIKKYPKLTQIGSTRPESQLGAYTKTFRGDGVPVSGFYTQEQIKEVVAYAKARYVTVIPEIEMPGHSSAVLAGYPELSCKPEQSYHVQMTWGIFKEVYCPTDTTFKFLEDVMSEVIDLFPDSPYIHIGGDEVLKDMCGKTRPTSRP